MKILEIKNIIRKEFPIYYRAFYTGLVVMELINKPIEFPLDFQIEQKPTGFKEVSLTFTQSVDYPLVPLQRELKKFIGALDSDGKLPN